MLRHLPGRSRPAAIYLVILLVWCVPSLFAPPASAAPPAPNIFLVTNTNDAGRGSLRQAIFDSDANPGTNATNVISFAIRGNGVKKIALSRPLPTITAAVDLDGYTEAGSSVNTASTGDNAVIRIQVDGAALAAGSQMVTAATTNITIRGISFTGVSGAGSAAIALIQGDVPVACTIEGCFIGLAPDGTAAGNATGIQDTVGGNTIGGTTADARNIISGNVIQVDLDNIGSSGPTSVVEGNYIGTDPSGTVSRAPAGSVTFGVFLENGASNNTIGGTATGAGNVISGNSQGVYLFDNGGATLVSNAIEGNLIGTDPTGKTAVPNTFAGVEIENNARANVIGGSSTAARNIISGNGRANVEILGTATQNSVQGNYIGTDISGTVALGATYGVEFQNGSFNVIGGATAGMGNLISGNGIGINITGGATANSVERNLIGTDFTGAAALPNTGDGIVFVGSTQNIVGNARGSGNIIAFNGGNGVTIGSSITDGATAADEVSYNSIYSNGKLGIDLGNDGVTPDDPVNPDTGPNNRQNYPVLQTVNVTPNGTTITGSLSTGTGEFYRVQLFSSPSGDPAGFGEGETFLTNVAVDLTSTPSPATFTGTVSGAIPDGTFITSTATDIPNVGFIQGNNTSEFSHWLVILPPNVTNPGNQTSTEGDKVSLQIAASDPNGGPLTYSAAGLPPNLAINAANGLISGTVAFNSAGTYNVSVTAASSTVFSNGAPRTTTVSFTWTVNAQSPVVTNPGPQTNNEGDTVSLQIKASDPAGRTLTYSAANLPTGLTIGARTGLISGTIAFNSAGTFNSSVTVSNGLTRTIVAFTWTVNALPPVVTNPGNQTNNEGDTVSLQIIATDPAGRALTYSAAGLPTGLAINAATGLISGTIPFGAAGTYNSSVTVSNGLKSSTVAFVWTVNGVGPTVTNPGSQTNNEGDVVSLQIQASDPGGRKLTYSAANLPTGLSINAATGLISGTVANLSAGTYNSSVTVSNGTASTFARFTWTINARPPVITNPGPQTNNEGDVVSLQIKASDPAGRTLTYTAANLPTGLSINAQTGLISGTVAFNSAGTFNSSVTVSNGLTRTVAAFTWTVNALPPTVTNPGPQTNNEGDTVSLQIVATDPAGRKLTYSASTLPNGLSINAANGLISGTISFLIAGTYNSSVTVSNGLKSSTVSFVWTVKGVGPNVTNPGNQTNNEGDVVSLQIQASDRSGATLNYSAANLPPGLTINKATGLISGTVANLSAGTYNSSVTVGNGEVATSANFTWTINARPPAITNPGNQTNNEGDTVSLAIKATDPAGRTLTYSATGLPGNLSINPGSGVISGTVANLSADIYTVTVTASNGLTSSSTSFTWTINARPAVVTNPGPQTNTEGDIVSLQIKATDPAGRTLTYSAAKLPPGLGINPNTGLISGVVQFLSAGVYNSSVTVSNGLATTTVAFTWTVLATTPTVISPGNQSNLEGAQISLQIRASDPSGRTLTYSAAGLPPGLSISPTTGLISGNIALESAGVFTVRITVSNGVNSASVTFTWTVGAQPPTVTNPGPQTNNEGDRVTLPVVATDPAGRTLTYSAANLPAGLSINQATGVISGVVSFLTAGTYNSSVTVSNGLVSTAVSFTWTVHALAPIVANPGPQSSTEGETISLLIRASDPAGRQLTFSASNLPPGLAIDPKTGLISGAIAPLSAGVYTVTVSASNGLTTGSATFAWTVKALGPILVNPGSQVSNEGDTVSLQIKATDPSGRTIVYSAGGLPPGLSINQTSGLISGVVATGSRGSYTVTVFAANAIATSSATFRWTVTVRMPVITNPGDQTNAEGQVIRLQIAASDPAGRALTFNAAGLPPGLGINPASGLISGTIAYGSAGSYPVTLSISNGVNGASVSFTWRVTAVPPVVSNPGPQTNTENDRVSLQIQASDPGGRALTYSASNLPAGLSINPGSGLISGTVAYRTAGSYAVTVTASNGEATGSAAFTWTIGARAVTITNPGNQVSTEGDRVNLPIIAADPSGRSLVFSASGLPPGLSIDGKSGVISGTIAYLSGGSYAVTVSVTNGLSTASTSFTWTVRIPSPAVTNPGPQTSTEGDQVTLQVKASDPAGRPLTYSAAGLPPGLSIDAKTGVISGSPPFRSAGAYTVTITVSNGAAYASVSFPWTINPSRPVVTSPGDQVNNEGDVISLAIQAKDPAGAPLTYSAVGLPPGLGINPGAGVITGTLPFTAAGIYHPTVTASNGVLSGSASFTWTVNNVDLPPVVTNPGNQTSLAGSTVSLQIAATDEDGDTLRYAATGLPQGLAINNLSGLISGSIPLSVHGVFPVTVTVTDPGHSVSVSFRWTVTKVETGPTIQNPGDQTNNDTDTVSLQIQARDADGDPLSFTATGLPPGLAISSTTGLISGKLSGAQVGTYTVTVTATDTTNDAPTGRVSTTFKWAITHQVQGGVLVMATLPFDFSGTDADAAQLFGAGVGADGRALIAIWDPLTNNYQYYPNLPGPNGRQTVAGCGYWVKVVRPATISSNAKPIASPYELPIPPGWNMIANPFTTALDFNSLQVKVDVAIGSIPANTPMSMQTAIANGIIVPPMLRYDNSTNQYVPATTLQPFEGYWLFIDQRGTHFHSVRIIFTLPGGTRGR